MLGRGAGAGHPDRERAPPAHDLGAGRLAGRDDPRRAPAALRHPAARPRRLRLHRRRSAALGAGQRPRGGGRARLGHRPGTPHRPGWSPSARSAWPASCAGSATCPSGSPRRPGWASGSRSCPRSRPSDSPAPCGRSSRRRAGGRRDAGGRRARRRLRAPDPQAVPGRAGSSPSVLGPRPFQGHVSRGTVRTSGDHRRGPGPAACRAPLDWTGGRPMPQPERRERRGGHGPLGRDVAPARALASIAPGTALRDGLERILRGRTGALIVLGHDKTVESHLHRRLHPRRPVHRHRPARAGQDGRRDRRSTATSPGSTGPPCT